MATVYLASDVRHERQVAVKVLRPDLSASIGSERFLQEIRIAARLSHPHILPLHDSGEANGLLYYVMPYVAGESLRQRLAREGELPVTDAARILRDVSDALAYAHQHGVVHRDIKPENILLTGRHALVADFGVAKALSEATGKNRITTAGVALGTPAYMSPEQAVADPHVDHRADIYAIGVVGYEMIAGAPPFTGGSPQQVLASQVTELPRPVTTRRPAMPPILATAIMRCLEKKPADRWQSADDLLAQIEAAQTTTGGSTPTDTRPHAAVSRGINRRLALAAVGALVAALAVGGWFMRSSGGDAGPAATLRDRTQLTYTGRVQSPAISPDGKQLAYVTRECTETKCAYAVDVQDVGGTATRRVLTGAASAYFIEWSPDRRNLLVVGTIGGSWGAHIVSLLGGPPRRAGPGGTMGASGVTFYAGGDSLLIAPDAKDDSVQWIRVATLGGAVGDSIAVRTGGYRVAGLGTIPGSKWIGVILAAPNHAEWLILDRAGRESVRHVMPFGVTRASVDALWLAPWLNDELSVIVRTSFDSATGRLSKRADTVYRGRLTGFSVNQAGTVLAVDDGTYQHSVYALDLSEALAGRFPDSRRLLQASTPLRAGISPGGERILIRRAVPAPAGGVDYRWSLLPFSGGSEVPVVLPAGAQSANWVDSATLAIYGRNGGRLRFSLFDVAARASRDEFSPPDSIVWDWVAVPGGGWVWIKAGGQGIGMRRGGKTSEFPKPPWYDVIQGLSASRSDQLAYRGWNAGTNDTMGVSMLSLREGTATRWFSTFVDDGRINALPDGSMVFHAYETAESATLIHITGPGAFRRLGTVPRPVSGLNHSADLKRAVVTTRDYFGDVWMMGVTAR